jgi:tRNA threonylcarbamoyladenosine biosynthesis protein TsaE
MLINFSLQQLDTMAAAVSLAITKQPIVAFYGAMGAGKTTCIAAICRHLGSADVVSSPTYGIINEYATDAGRRIYHMDWYRLAGEEEAIAAGVEEALVSGDICLIEWPERAPDLLPEDTLTLSLEVLDHGHRQLKRVVLNQE